MNIVIIKEKIKSALNAVTPLTLGQITLPILRNVLIETSDGKVVFTSTNLEMAMVYKAMGKVIESGALTLPAQLFLDIINNIQSERINFVVKNNENTVEITTDNYHAKLQGSSQEEFPIIPQIKTPLHRIEISATILKNAFHDTIIATQHSELRAELNNIFFSVTPEQITLVGTDSFRLAEKTIGKNQFQINNPGEFNILIPLRAAQEVLNIFDDKDIIHILHDENQILFQNENISLISRLSEGQFPDYKSIIPELFSTQCKTNREDLIHAIKLASVFGSRGAEVTIETLVDKKVIRVSSRDDRVGEHECMVSARTEGESIKITFNAKYLLDGLRELIGEEIEIGFHEENKPSILRSHNDASYFYIVMPILKT